MANKTCTWFDKTFKWVGILAVIVAFLKYVVYKYFKSHYAILTLDLAHQLGI
jgi:predicted negative regulator of RcsB-dependent stress response